MSRREMIRRGIKRLVEWAVEVSKPDRATEDIIQYLHSQGLMMRIGELPELTVSYIEALQGGIIEKHIKNGIENMEELKTKVFEELPQVICDAVNSGVANCAVVESLIELKTEEEVEEFEHGS